MLIWVVMVHSLVLPAGVVSSDCGGVLPGYLSWRIPGPFERPDPRLLVPNVALDWAGLMSFTQLVAAGLLQLMGWTMAPYKLY